MFLRVVSLLVFLMILLQGNTQEKPVVFISSDTALQTAFNRAKEQALFYKGDPADPVAPWYEAALPTRNAFCIRDVSHQAIPAEILGLHAANKNMLTLFVKNISESKDWCTYWEMNKFGKPAPEDYRNDTAFWYNLNANFELIYTCWRLYLWTGDSSYISNPAFTGFFELTATKYIDRWYLQPGDLLKRPAYPNAPQPFNFSDYFHRCRGIPSYYEAVDDMGMSADLVAAIYRAMKTYSAIARLQKNTTKANLLEQKAEAYRKHLEDKWWNAEEQRYYNFLTNQNGFGSGEGDIFLLWYNALTNSSRIKHTISRIVNEKLNVENMSYLPYQLSRYGYSNEAYNYILHLTNPNTKRREYPEVSYGVIEGIVQGMMGIEADARFNRIMTVYNGKSSHFAELRNLGLVGSVVNVRQEKNKSSLQNQGRGTLNWRVVFNGRFTYVVVNGNKRKPFYGKDMMGKWRSYIDVNVLPGATIEVTAVNK